MKVAVIERKHFGGACVNNGCMSTKTLVASAYAARLAARAEDYGVVLDAGFRIDMAKVKARKDNVVLTARRGIETWLAAMPGCTVIRGHARFISPHGIAIGTERISAEKIFINVGARALIPPIPGLDQINYFTNVSIMDVDFIPKHLLILGGSTKRVRRGGAF
jgi:pyruvate/2-oxoglutarate dehydrogenase complex dihydrolipoamide dehydrogenase (E3) component